MFICYGDHFIENRTVQDIRDESDADSWNLVIPHRAARKDGSVGGLHADDSDTRSLLFKNLAHTREWFRPCQWQTQNRLRLAIRHLGQAQLQGDPLPSRRDFAFPIFASMRPGRSLA